MPRLIFFIVLLLVSGCRQADKEVQRTQEQLGKLSQDLGIDSTGMQTAVADAKQAYRSNVQPLVDGAGNYVDGYVDDMETLRTVKESANDASEKIARVHASISVTVNQAMRDMPQSENELDRMVDDYSKQFAGWLKANFVTLDGAFASPESRTKRAGIAPRKRPHSIR